MFDLLIRQGRIIDGTGRRSFVGDVGIQGGVISEVGCSITGRAERVLDAEDLAVAPGFIDLHSHSDLYVFSDPFAQPKLRQGVTTEVMGNDGLAVAPVGCSEDEAEAYVRPLLGSMNGPWRWRSLGQYLQCLEESRLAINSCCLAPHNTIRACVAGFGSAGLTGNQLEEAKGMVRQCMREGALGMSTGLLYAPGCFSDSKELAELAGVVSEFGGVHVSHIRSESDGLRESIDEILQVGLDAKCRTHVSHLKVSGKRNWGLAIDVLSRLDRAREKGIEVTCDQYPYPAGSTMLSALLPPWALQDGMPSLLLRLESDTFRKKVAVSIEEGITGWDNVVGAVGYDNIMVNGVSSERNRSCEGQSLGSIARSTGEDPVDAVCRLLVEEGGEVTIVVFQQSDDDLKNIACYSHAAVATDGVCSARRPHPRLYGTYPRVLGRFARDRGWFSLEEGVRKMTSLPASIMGIEGLGRLAPGYKADLVVFDPNTIIDTATFEDPIRTPIGVERVIVSGAVVLEEGNLTGARSGKVLRRGKPAI